MTITLTITPHTLDANGDWQMGYNVVVPMEGATSAVETYDNFAHALREIYVWIASEPAADLKVAINGGEPFDAREFFDAIAQLIDEFDDNTQDADVYEFAVGRALSRYAEKHYDEITEYRADAAEDAAREAATNPFRP